jgi:hypothetical protein
MIYETDTDLVRIWTGAVWRTLSFTAATNGTVLQVVNGQYGAQVSAGVGAGWLDTGLQASITPTSTTSKVLVLVAQVGLAKSAADAYLALRLVRAGTQIIQFAHSTGYTGETTNNRVGSDATFCLDSPATTSSINYKTQIQNTGPAGVVFAQINGSPLNDSTIVLMEIAG